MDTSEEHPEREKVRTYFLGSGSIAVPTLAALAKDARVTLVGSGTQPDRCQGRRRVVTPTPVGAWCQEHGHHVDKVAKVRDLAFLARLRALSLDVILVFSFGQILPRQLLQLPRRGCVNVHASLLPRHRGAAPVNAAILAGDRRSGISIMAMDEGLDAGPVYERFELELTGREYAPELEGQLAAMAANHAVNSLVSIARGDAQAVPQPATGVSYAPKLNKHDGQVDWQATADEVERQVRAYYPWPGTWFTLHGPKQVRRLTITAASVAPTEESCPPGTIMEASKHAWKIACGRDLLVLERVIPQGKREMTGAEFLLGCPLPEGSNVNPDETDPS